jgi:hypothetical protein
VALEAESETQKRGTRRRRAAPELLKALEDIVAYPIPTYDAPAGDIAKLKAIALAAIATVKGGSDADK